MYSRMLVIIFSLNIGTTLRDLVTDFRTEACPKVLALPFIGYTVPTLASFDRLNSVFHLYLGVDTNDNRLMEI